MKQILIIGAGRSATSLINYTLEHSKTHEWFITLADASLEQAESKIDGHPNGKAILLDVMKVDDRREAIDKADIVVSMLPAHLHMHVAKDCLTYKKHLVTASYVSQQLYELNDEARESALIFMGEMGLDPGIDHMSAMQKINQIRAMGGELVSFKSYAGGLVAPESDDNPWHYKFSWSPRNVVLAGQGTAQYMKDGHYKYIPYNRLFKSYKLIDVPGLGEYEAYANRDSLLYREAYGLRDTPTIIRATLRAKGFCDSWNAFVQLGLTDDSYPILASEELTYREFIEAYLDKDFKNNTSMRERLATFLNVGRSSEIIDKLDWLGLFDDKKIGLKNASPAQILQHLLEQKWKMKPDDKDMIVMQHDFEYVLNGERKGILSTMILKGENSEITGMSKLVGLPLGIFVKLVLLDKVKESGVQIPTREEIYEPVLKELENYGVVFKEQEYTPK